MSNRENDHVLRELTFLAALDSVHAEVDTSIIAEIQDWSGAVVGEFYGATVEQPSSAAKPHLDLPFITSQPVTVNMPLSYPSGSMDYAITTTRLLVDMQAGNKDAEAGFFAAVYDELHGLAASYLRRERPDHALQPAELVHEAYLRLVEQKQQNWQNKGHFQAVSAHVMRQILVDHARSRTAKREGQERPRSLDKTMILGTQRSEELVALDEALSRLETLDRRQSQIVELRFFGGLTEEEISHILGVSVRTIKRDWNIAKAWLYAEMTK